MSFTAPQGEPPAMSDYGVGGPDWSALPWAWAGERLTGTRNYCAGAAIASTGRQDQRP